MTRVLQHRGPTGPGKLAKTPTKIRLLGPSPVVLSSILGLLSLLPQGTAWTDVHRRQAIAFKPTAGPALGSPMPPPPVGISPPPVGPPAGPPVVTPKNSTCDRTLCPSIPESTEGLLCSSTCVGSCCYYLWTLDVAGNSSRQSYRNRGLSTVDQEQGLHGRSLFSSNSTKYKYGFCTSGDSCPAPLAGFATANTSTCAALCSNMFPVGYTPSACPVAIGGTEYGCAVSLLVGESSVAMDLVGVCASESCPQYDVTYPPPLRAPSSSQRVGIPVMLPLLAMLLGSLFEFFGGL